MKKQHDQTLVDILAEMPEFHHPRWNAVRQLVTAGYFYPLNTTYVPEHKVQIKVHTGEKKWVHVFPQDPWECPILATDFLPCSRLPWIEDVKKVLKEEVKTQKFRIVPPLSTSQEHLMTATGLIENLRCPTTNLPAPSSLVRGMRFTPSRTTGGTIRPGGSLIHLFSPTLQDHFTKRFTVDGAKGTLEQTPHQVTIMPRGGYLEAIYHEHYTVSTLMTGKKLWVAFPANPNNLDVIKTTYQALHSKNDDMSLDLWQDVILPGNMENGIVFVQHVGETVVIPPFWPRMVMSIYPSLSVTTYVVKSIFLAQRLDNTELWLSANKMWPNHQEEQEHLVAYAQQLVDHFQRVMKSELREKISHTGDSICKNWNTTQNSVLKILGSIEDMYLAEKLRDSFLQAWVDYLVNKSRPANKCPICLHDLRKWSLPDAPTSVDAAYLQRAKITFHFQETHWK